MMHGRNNGKKIMAVRIIKHSFEIIHLLTDQNPIQVLVDAIVNRYARFAQLNCGRAWDIHFCPQCAIVGCC